MHAGARIFAKWGYAVIAGNLARVVVETTEVVCIHHQTDSVLRSYARHRGHDCEHLGELFVRLNELGDSLVYLLNFLVEFCEIIVLIGDFSMVSFFSPLRT